MRARFGRHGKAVSYTHLDVYKRQSPAWTPSCRSASPEPVSYTHLDVYKRQPEITDALERLGVQSLWSHQAEAAQLAHEGRHVAVATGTASGLSLIHI